MATKKPRYMISVDDDMFNAIEDFRFERRFQTRSEATTELIRLGLEQLKKEEAKKAQKKQAELTNLPKHVEDDCNDNYVNAAHSIEGATDEDKQFDEDIMSDENF